MMKVRNNEEGSPHKRSILGTGKAHREVIISKEQARKAAKAKRNLDRKNTNRSDRSICSGTTQQSAFKGSRGSQRGHAKFPTDSRMSGG